MRYFKSDILNTNNHSREISHANFLIFFNIFIGYNHARSQKTLQAFYFCKSFVCCFSYFLYCCMRRVCNFAFSRMDCPL